MSYSQIAVHPDLRIDMVRTQDYSCRMRSEWDRARSRANRRRHGVSFEEAVQVFDDPLHLSKLDARFDYIEERWITVGSTRKAYCTVVARLYFDEGDDEVRRVRSARRATTNEVKQYEIRE